MDGEIGHTGYLSPSTYSSFGASKKGPISLLCTLTPLFPRSVHTPSNCPKMTGYSKYILIKIPYPCTLFCHYPISVHTLLSISQKCAHSNGQWFALSHFCAHPLSNIPKVCTWEMVSVSQSAQTIVFSYPKNVHMVRGLCTLFPMISHSHYLSFAKGH